MIISYSHDNETFISLFLIGIHYFGRKSEVLLKNPALNINFLYTSWYQHPLISRYVTLLDINIFYIYSPCSGISTFSMLQDIINIYFWDINISRYQLFSHSRISLLSMFLQVNILNPRRLSQPFELGSSVVASLYHLSLYGTHRTTLLIFIPLFKLEVPSLIGLHINISVKMPSCHWNTASKTK